MKKKIILLGSVFSLSFYALCFAGTDPDKPHSDPEWSAAISAWEIFAENFLKEELERDSKTPAYQRSEELRNHKREFIEVGSMALPDHYFPEFKFYSYDSPWGYPMFRIFAVKKDSSIFDLGDNFFDHGRKYIDFLAKQGVKISNDKEAIDIVEIYDYLFGAGSLGEDWDDFIDKERLKGKSVYLYSAEQKDKNFWEIKRFWQCGDDIEHTRGCQYFLEPRWEFYTDESGIIQKGERKMDGKFSGNADI